MIERLQNKEIEVSIQIHSVFQLSYAVEAKILEVIDFPPLNRPIEDYRQSNNLFFGYSENKDVAGIIEISYLKNGNTKINSLVVHPVYFRRGIARKLLEFVFDNFDSKIFMVETGAKNMPATEL